jgi:hypothetical protein
MTDNQESAISDPRASLKNFSNRQESSFQYGDPPKYQTDVTKSQLNYSIIIISFYL